MNRLWVRLSIFFSFFALSGVLIFTPIFRILVSYNANDVITQTREKILTQLTTYYSEYNTWLGVNGVLRSYENAIPRGLGTEPIALVFANASGRIIYDGGGQHEANSLSQIELSKAFPVQVNSDTRGYLFIQKLEPPFDRDPNSTLRNILNSFIVFAALTGGVGIIAGIWVSRQVTAPLSALATTVRTFNQPSSTQRAKVGGTIEVREVASAFNQMADTLAETERLRRNMVGDVAHELRTPLTVLQANIQAILDDLYPLNKTEIQNLQVQTDLLQRLVSDLHELAQAEAHQLPLHRMTVNMNDLVQQLVDHFSAVSKSRNIALTAATPADTIRVFADPDRISQVLQNLIHNALTHTPDGGSITVRLAKETDQMRVEVRDTGAGVSAADQKRIFERFYRTDEARSRETGGAGLGLPISKAIIEMHNGTIRVDSDGIAGHGTTFTILIPIAQKAEVELAVR